MNTYKNPDKIYVTPVRTWDTKHIPDLQDNIYIRKDALLEWLEQEVLKLDVRSDNDAVAWGQRNAFKQAINKLNST